MNNLRRKTVNNILLNNLHSNKKHWYKLINKWLTFYMQWCNKFKIKATFTSILQWVAKLVPDWIQGVIIIENFLDSANEHLF